MRGRLSGKKSGKQGEVFPLPFGLSLLLVSFLVLCLFTLAAISLVTARNYYHTGRKSADHTSAYYRAANTAEEKVAELDGKLEKAGTVLDSLPASQSLCVTVDDTHVLVVELQAETDGETPAYRVTKWQVEPSEDWQPDQSIRVLNPDSAKNGSGKESG
ncbi:MAG: hypothetical protein PUE47_04970 [Lachnospiraceae bacterium]|nr:hypothetical protein [Lachnospiraceae bacterium]